MRRRWCRTRGRMRLFGKWEEGCHPWFFFTFFRQHERGARPYLKYYAPNLVRRSELDNEHSMTKKMRLRCYEGLLISRSDQGRGCAEQCSRRSLVSDKVLPCRWWQVSQVSKERKANTLPRPTESILPLRRPPGVWRFLTSPRVRLYRRVISS